MCTQQKLRNHNVCTIYLHSCGRNSCQRKSWIQFHYISANNISRIPFIDHQRVDHQNLLLICVNPYVSQISTSVPHVEYILPLYAYLSETCPPWVLLYPIPHPEYLILTQGTKCLCYNRIRTTHWLVKKSILQFIEPIREGVRKIVPSES